MEGGEEEERKKKEKKRRKEGRHEDGWSVQGGPGFGPAVMFRWMDSTPVT
jgi:hypothetical protein